MSLNWINVCMTLSCSLPINTLMMNENKAIIWKNTKYHFAELAFVWLHFAALSIKTWILTIFIIYFVGDLIDHTSDIWHIIQLFMTVAGFHMESAVAKDVTFNIIDHSVQDFDTIFKRMTRRLLTPVPNSPWPNVAVAVQGWWEGLGNEKGYKRVKILEHLQESHLGVFRVLKTLG